MPLRVTAKSVSGADTIVSGPRRGQLEPDRHANNRSFGSLSGTLLFAECDGPKAPERNRPALESSPSTSSRDASIFLPREIRSPGGAGSYLRLPVGPCRSGLRPTIVDCRGAASGPAAPPGRAEARPDQGPRARNRHEKAQSSCQRVSEKKGHCDRDRSAITGSTQSATGRAEVRIARNSVQS